MRMQPAGGIRMSKAWNKKSAPHGYRDEAKRNRDERAWPAAIFACKGNCEG